MTGKVLYSCPRFSTSTPAPSRTILAFVKRLFCKFCILIWIFGCQAIIISSKYVLCKYVYRTTQNFANGSHSTLHVLSLKARDVLPSQEMAFSASPSLLRCTKHVCKFPSAQSHNFFSPRSSVCERCLKLHGIHALSRVPGCELSRLFSWECSEWNVPRHIGFLLNWRFACV